MHLLNSYWYLPGGKTNAKDAGIYILGTNDVKVRSNGVFFKCKEYETFLVQ
jgi:hypothetical protein